MTTYEDLKPFFDEMLAIMQHHDAKKGDSWKLDRPWMSSNLQVKLWEEFREVVENPHLEDSENLHELIDLANICAMIWLRGLEKAKLHNSTEKETPE